MSNPVFNNCSSVEERILDGQPCSVQGTINKTFLLLCVTIAAFFLNFRMCLMNNAETASMLGMVSIFAALILALIISFKPKTAPILSPIYAFCEGLLLGFISYIFEAQYKGIAVQAVVATFGTLFAMLMLYSAKVITATEKFRSTIFIATIGIALIYLISFVLSFFHINVPAIYSSSPIGIAFSVIVCLIAAFNLILDFDFVERASANLLPKYYEWYGAFGLLVTIVWLYIEILRLLAKLRSNNR